MVKRWLAGIAVTGLLCGLLISLGCGKSTVNIDPNSLLGQEFGYEQYTQQQADLFKTLSGTITLPPEINSDLLAGVRSASDTFVTGNIVKIARATVNGVSYPISINQQTMTFSITGVRVAPTYSIEILFGKLGLKAFSKKLTAIEANSLSTVAVLVAEKIGLAPDVIIGSFSREIAQLSLKFKAYFAAQLSSGSSLLFASPALTKDVSDAETLIKRIISQVTTATGAVTIPTVVSVAPVENAVNVAIKSEITVNFSEPMNTSTITENTFTVASGGTAIAGSLTYSGDGQAATFTPSAVLPRGNMITVTVTTGVEDLSGNALAANKTWVFTTSTSSDTAAPTVVSVIPVEGAVNVAISSKITVNFSEAMDTSNITQTTFTVASGGTAIAGSLASSGDGKTATFTPSVSMPYGSEITVTITTGVKDLAGNALAANRIWTFTTAVAPDKTAPTVVSVVPVENAVNVAVSSKITVNFSEVLDATTITGTTIIVTSAGTAIDGNFAYDGNGKTVTFTPSVSLPYGSVITVTVTTGVKDPAANAMAANKVWTFSTVTVPDGISPTVVSVIPMENAVNVATRSKVTVNFSEALDTSTITGTTFTVASGVTAIAGSFASSGDGKTATFTPSVSMPYGSEITVTVTTGVKDLARNALAANKIWTFTTAVAPDTTAPTVVSVVPIENAVNVATSSNVTVNFSEAMDTSTLTGTTFTVASGGASIGGSLAYSGDWKTATFTPSVSWPSGCVITVTVTTGVKDLAGNALVASKVWTFTTATAPDTTAPTIVSVVPVENALNVAANSKITVNFSEAMNTSTITGATYTVASGGTAIAGSLAYSGDGKMATFTPSASLPYGSVITVTVTTSAKDIAGNALAVNKVWNFSTEGKLLITEIGSAFYGNVPTWFEVYNNTGQPIQLSEYQLRSQSILRTTSVSQGIQTFNLPALSIPSTKYALIRGKATDNVNNGSQIVYTLNGTDIVPFWTADGFVEILKSGSTIDFVKFGAETTAPMTSVEWSGGAAPALSFSASDYGKSIARDVNNVDTNTSPDWTSRMFASPGGKNDVTSDVDADGDGIPDCAEVFGSTFAGLDLYGWGARTGQRDIFIHIDYMNSADPGVNPRKEALDMVQTVFSNHVPSYVVHFDVGNLFGTTLADHCLENKSHQVAYSQAVTLGTVSGKANLYDYKNTSMDIARRQIFHYLLMANSQNIDGSGGSSGLAELNGNDLIVTLGGWGLDVAPAAQLNELVNIQAATIMHEFGHNLGLRHGGNLNTNYIPNYYSVMNYEYQIYGLPAIGNASEGDRFYYYRYSAIDGYASTSSFQQYFPGGVGDMHNNFQTTNFSMDYSDGTGGAINETTIDENLGLNRAVSVGVDYNGSGLPTDAGVTMDLNPGEGTALEIVNDFNDWGAINLLFQRNYNGDGSGFSPYKQSKINYLTNDKQEYIIETLTPACLRTGR